MNITNSELIILALQEQVRRLRELANEAATLLQDTAGTEGVAAPWFAKWQNEQG